MKVCQFCGAEILAADKTAFYWASEIHVQCIGYAVDSNWRPPVGDVAMTVPSGRPPLKIKEVIALDQIAIGSVVWREFRPWYVTSMIDTMKTFGTVFDYFVVQGLYIISARNILVQQVLKVHEAKPVLGILWIDADIMWTPADVASVLDTAAANPDAIIGALYPGREGNMTVGKVYSQDDVAEADFLGFGFTWTPIKCFLDHPDPWFFNTWENGQIVGEDVWFCKTQKQFGRKILAIRQTGVKHLTEEVKGITGHVAVYNDDGIRYL